MSRTATLLIHHHRGAKPTKKHFLVQRQNCLNDAAKTETRSKSAVTLQKIPLACSPSPEDDGLFTHKQQSVSSVARLQDEFLRVEGHLKSLRGRTSPTICSASGRRGLRHISAIKSSPGGQQAQVQASSPTLLRSLLCPNCPSARPPPPPQPPADRGHSGCLLSLLLKASLSPPDLVSPKGA